MRTDLLPNAQEGWIHVAERIAKKIKENLEKDGCTITADLLGEETVLAFLGSHMETDEEAPKRKTQLPDSINEQTRDLLMVVNQLPKSHRGDFIIRLQEIFLKETPD